MGTCRQVEIAKTAAAWGHARGIRHCCVTTDTLGQWVLPSGVSRILSLFLLLSMLKSAWVKVMSWIKQGKTLNEQGRILKKTNWNTHSESCFLLHISLVETQLSQEPAKYMVGIVRWQRRKHRISLYLETEILKAELRYTCWKPELESRLLTPIG